MNAFQRSWLLLKSSLSVIGRNKQLLIFPVIIFLCTTFIILFFLAPPVLRPTGYSYASAEHWKAISHSLFRETADQSARGGSQVVFTPGAMAYLAFLYLLSMFIATFCNVAFFHEILAALSGQPVSIVRGLKFALSKMGAILMWTLFAGLVGLIIKTIEERMGLIGRIIAKIVGIAWSVASVFAIPVIVCQEGNANPLSVVRKSAEILTRTWGEALIGYAGLGIANVVIFLGSLFSLVAMIALSVSLHQIWFVVLAVGGWLVALFVWSYVSGVASQVYKGALYLYASQGVISQPYNQELLDMAWKRKKS
jgi:hypothetical protein